MINDVGFAGHSGQQSWGHAISLCVDQHRKYPVLLMALKAIAFQMHDVNASEIRATTKYEQFAQIVVMSW